MTRIPTATRRRHVEVRASQTGPKLPSLHALPPHALPRFTQLLVYQPCTYNRAWLSPDRKQRTTFHIQPDGFPTGPQRPRCHARRITMPAWYGELLASIAVAVPVQAASGEVTATVTGIQVRGPGDVLGLDERQIIRRYPE